MKVTSRAVGWAVLAGVSLAAAPAGIAWATGEDGAQVIAPSATPTEQREGERWAHPDGRPRMESRERQRGLGSDVGTCGMTLPASLDPASPTDQQALAFMAQEEKLAGDLYDVFAEAWDSATFARIARAEDRHLDAVRTLMEAYDIADPTSDAAPGEFADVGLQDFYDDLLERGSESEAAALTAAALVEETDIADLRERESDSATIDATFARLEAGSTRHLAAFVSALDARGVAYEASVLDADEVHDLTGVPSP